jgi:hypothetical protein
VLKTFQILGQINTLSPGISNHNKMVLIEAYFKVSKVQDKDNCWKSTSDTHNICMCVCGGGWFVWIPVSLQEEIFQQISYRSESRLLHSQIRKKKKLRTCIKNSTDIFQKLKSAKVFLREEKLRKFVTTSDYHNQNV